MESFFRDLRHAGRMLSRQRAYTLAALLALALGVGANSAIFSVFDAILLTPLPYPEADRLLRIWDENDGKDIERNPISPVAFADYREQAKSFSDIAGWWFPVLNLSSEDGEPERVTAVNVTDNFFDVLALPPLLGRGFEPGEDQSGRPQIAVLSHGLWQRRFGGRTEALGKDVLLDGQRYEIVGVMPRGFAFPDDTQVWLPLGWDPAGHYRGARFFGAVARLAPDITQAQAQAELDAFSERFGREFAFAYDGWRALSVNLNDDLVGDVRPALRILLGAVAFVLLIACANVANLLLAQASAREKEIAVRSALGAGGWRLARQLVTESLLLAILGGGLGLLAAALTTRILVAWAPPEIPRMEHVAVDGRTLLFTLGAVTLASLLFSLAPVWQALRADVNGALKDGTRGASGGAGGRRLRGSLVVAEIALAMVLLFGAGLLMRSFYRVLAEDPGFNPRHTLAFNLQLPRSSYEDWPAVNAFYDRLIDRLGALPGVEEAGAAGFLPFEAGFRVDFSIEGFEAQTDRDRPEAQYRPVTPGYFRALGIPLQQGRAFDDRDTPDKPGVVILNRAAAERYWPGGSPVGETLVGQARAFGPLGRVLTEGLEVEVVGVVGNVKNTSIESRAEPAMYFPHRQLAYRSMNVVVQAQGAPEAVASAIKAAVWELDSLLPLDGLRTLEEHLGSAVARRRFVMLLLSCFAGLAVALAAIGTYGVMSYVAGQRRKEMGIRLALGARRADVVRMVTAQGMALAAAGIALGLGGAWLMRRLMESQVYGIGTTDWRAIVTGTTVLATAALLAAYLPARRASRTDPVVALRED